MVENNVKYTQIFHSYNHGSKNIVKEIARRLENNFSIWIDEKKVKKGDDLTKKIVEGILESDVVLCFITKKYAESDNCLAELSLSMEYNKKVICVLLEDIKKKELETNINIGQVRFLINRKLHLYAYKPGRTFDPWTEDLFQELFDTILTLGVSLKNDNVFETATINRYKNVSDKYKILELIGEGGFARVFTVTEKSSDDMKAMKVINTMGIHRNGKLLNDVKRETDILAKLNHENIIKHYESFYAEKQACYCIVIEYCEDGCLTQELDKLSLEKINNNNHQLPQDLNKIHDWLIDLSSALSYLHEQKIIHRDIKSENVFIKNGKLKLGDFGVSRFNLKTTYRQTLTKKVGTLNKMSPEMLVDDIYSFETDVWSLGCLFYEIIYLEFLFDVDREDVLEQISKKDYRLLDSKPNKYSKIIIAMIKWNRKERPTSKDVEISLVNLSILPQNYVEKNSNSGGTSSGGVAKGVRILPNEGVSDKDAFKNGKNLINKDASIKMNSLDEDLIEACNTSIENVEEIKILINRGANVNAVDKYGKTALILATFNYKTEASKILLDKGANVNAFDNDGETALMKATESMYLDIVEILLNRGANVNAVNKHGETALMIGSENGYDGDDHAKTVNLLLNKGANIDAVDNFGDTALMKAVYKGNAKIVEILLKGGANVNIVDKNGKTAFDIAKGKGCRYDIIDLFSFG